MFDDVKIDRSNENTSLFIEIDGINHFTINNKPTVNTIIKNDLLK